MRWVAITTCLVSRPWVTDAIALRTKGGPETYESIPDFHTTEQLVHSTLDTSHSVEVAASERNAALSAVQAAESEALALEADKKAVESSEKAHRNYLRTEAATKESARLEHVAEDAAQNIRAYIRSIDDLAKSAANQALKDVVRNEIKKLNNQVSATRLEYKLEKEEDYKRAAEAAVNAVVPYKSARYQSEKFLTGYALRGREVATASAALKKEAMKVAAEAQKFQADGNVVTAAQFMIKAHDLMNQGLALQATALNFQNTAQTIQNNVGTYDLAGKSAMVYAAHEANPSGPAVALPPPPAPLS